MNIGAILTKKWPTIELIALHTEIQRAISASGMQMSIEEVLASDVTITNANGVEESIGLSVVLPAAGIYLVSFVIRGAMEFSAGSSASIIASLYDITESALLADSECEVVYSETIGEEFHNTTTGVIRLEIGEEKEIEVQVSRNGASGWTTSKVLSNANGHSRLIYMKIV